MRGSWRASFRNLGETLAARAAVRTILDQGRAGIVRCRSTDEVDDVEHHSRLPERRRRAGWVPAGPPRPPGVGRLRGDGRVPHAAAGGSRRLDRADPPLRLVRADRSPDRRGARASRPRAGGVSGVRRPAAGRGRLLRRALAPDPLGSGVRPVGARVRRRRLAGQRHAVRPRRLRPVGGDAAPALPVGRRVPERSGPRDGRAGRRRDRPLARAGDRLGRGCPGGPVRGGHRAHRGCVPRLRGRAARAVPARAPRLPGRRGPRGPTAPHGAADHALTRAAAPAVAARGAARAARPRPDRGGGTLSHGPLAERARVLGPRRPAAPVDAAALSLARHPHRRGRLGYGGHGSPHLRCPAGASARAAAALREPAHHVSRRTLARRTPGGRPIMLMRKLGRTGLKVAALCLGGNTFGWTTDQKASEAVLDAYVEAGGNFIDTADVYSRWAPGNKGGESEHALGLWVSARKHRPSVLIATKVCGPMGSGPNDKGLSRQHIMEGVEASLRRLQTDYIDLYQAHWDDRETPLDETLRAFDDLVRQGKVRYIGASNYPAWRLTRARWESDAHGTVRYECLQPKYNLVIRDEYERELEPLCLEQEVGVIPYSSLASGFLSGKYRAGEALPKTARAGGVEKTYMNDRGFRVLAAVEKVAAAASATAAQVSLSWLAHRPGITAPIASATTVPQLKELVGGIELRLDAEATAALDQASAWREG